MIIVHHLNNSRSQRVLWLLEELGVPYEVKHYQRGPDMRAPAELRQVHALGKSPIITDSGITDGDTVIAETGAIIEYLLEIYGPNTKEGGRLVPPAGTPSRRRFTYWLHYAEGSAMPLLLLKLIFTRMPRGAPALLRPVVNMIAGKALGTLVDPQLQTHLRYWSDELTRNGGWFAGLEFSAADIMMSFPVEAAAARARLDRSHAPLSDFLARIHARPAYMRALETGGPYALMK